MDESEITIVPDIVARLDTVDNLIHTTRETVENACERVNRANDSNRQISRRMDTHGIIVVERFATFHYY